MDNPSLSFFTIILVAALLFLVAAFSWQIFFSSLRRRSPTSHQAKIQQVVINGEDLAKAVFRCDSCGEAAATVKLIPKEISAPDNNPKFPSAGTIIISGFLVDISDEVAPDRYLGVLNALTDYDPRMLHRVFHLWAPFYCCECEHSYCAKHWDVEPAFDSEFPGWYDSSYGRCPKGHRRVVDD